MGRVFTWVARGSAAFLIAATVLPFVRTHRWYVRAFDFPRLQVAAVAALWSVSAATSYRRLNRLDRRLLWATLGALLTQGAQILPYTRLARKEVLSSPDQADFKILTGNVLQSNRRTDIYKEHIAALQPDIVLLTEVNSWWERELRHLEKSYPYVVRRPLENTYGMILYSRLPLIDPQVRFLVKKEIPSIVTQVRLRDGRQLWLHAVHPEPPGTLRHDKTIRGSGPRDVELLLLAEELVEQKEPVIVVGDFNDVAWSHTTRLFKRLSRLLDPRRGRGMFNTFHADYPPLRYPLDHLFHSEHFLLVDFKRLPHTGSDHFPIFVSLKLAKQAPALQEQAPPSKSDFQEAEETVKTAPTD